MGFTSIQIVLKYKISFVSYSVLFYSERAFRVSVDPELILGILGTRQEYILSIAVCHEHILTNLFTPMGNLALPIHLPAWVWDVGGKSVTRRKPMWTSGEHVKLSR